MRRPASALLAGACACLTLGAAPAPPQAAAPAAASAAGPPRLSWPVACEVGRTCFIQHYVDRDPGPGARDYTCGPDTYDKHNGTDIRLPDMAAEARGVAVLAAADGQVLRVRDGVPDVSVRERGLQAVQGTECGNGLVVDHGGGWQTQYCHMKQGSLKVKPGQAVKAGEPLGEVGLSGETEFPHVHVTVRHDDKDVDPFAPDIGAGGACGSGRSLWRVTPPYAGRQVINVGFADRALGMGDIEAGGVARPGPDSAVLAAYVRATGLHAGDALSLTLYGPQGQVLAPATNPPLTSSEAQRFILAGKKRPPSGWPKGAYRAVLKIDNAGRTVLTRAFETSL